jgi:hypothetical protein
MKLDFPRYTERLGAVSIHAVQRIYELDSGKSKGFLSSHQTIKKFDYDEISNILHDMAIVVPVKEEKLKLLEGVLSGIPNECLVIIVSNSQRSPVDRFEMEAGTVRQLGRFMDKRLVIIHQRDPTLGDILKKLGYDSILASDGKVRNGKAHLNDMLEAALAIMAGSRACPADLKESLEDQLAHIIEKGRRKVDYRKKYPVIESISTIPIDDFARELREKAETFSRFGGLR